MRAESSARLPRRRRHVAAKGVQMKRKAASAALPEAKSPRSALADVVAAGAGVVTTREAVDAAGCEAGSCVWATAQRAQASRSRNTMRPFMEAIAGRRFRSTEYLRTAGAPLAVAQRGNGRGRLDGGRGTFGGGGVGRVSEEWGGRRARRGEG